jgi:hypothetical protein
MISKNNLPSPKTQKLATSSPTKKNSVRGLQRSEFSILQLNDEQFQKLKANKKFQILNVEEPKSPEGGSAEDPPVKKKVYSVLVSARMDHDSPPRSSMQLFKQFQKNSTKLKRSTSAELLLRPLLL